MMRIGRAVLTLLGIALLSSCAPDHKTSAKLNVAAAANLTDVLGEVGRAFRAKTGIELVVSYASTAQLAQQIDNGAPFDLFAAADTEHVDGLVGNHKLTADSRAVYALGQLALWIPGGDKSGIRTLQDLGASQVRFVAIAQPDLAPYGKASVEALTNAGLWQKVQPKVVYGNSINAAKQMAASGNADAAFTAYSLVLHDPGIILKIEPQLYHPIEQALAIVAASPRIAEAKLLRSFLLSTEGQAILVNSGYLLPSVSR
jgi:molybdate transport system substrate-binding protein